MNIHDSTNYFPLFYPLNFKSEDTKTNWGGVTPFNYSPDLREYIILVEVMKLMRFYYNVDY